MILGKSVIAIIPARGGSKGVLRKNIKLLEGKPLIAWTIEQAKKSKYIDRLILSSEDDEIIKIAKDFGCEIPFIRPKELAEDNTPAIDPVIHAINTLPEKYDYVCLLQPTSPLRKAEDIDGCIEKCILNDAPSCVSVTKVTEHPYWMYEIDGNERLIPLFPDKFVTRRQDLQIFYILNGAIYVSKTNEILEQKKFVTKDTLGYVMDRKSSLDIDDEIDFHLAEIIKRIY